MNAYSLYVKERWATGNVGGGVIETSSQLGRDWKALSEGERKVSFPPRFPLPRPAFLSLGAGLLMP